MKTISRAMLKRQCERELHRPRYKRGSDWLLGYRDQLGLTPGQRGGTVVVEENIPMIVDLGVVAMLAYVSHAVTTVGYDYTLRDLLRNKKEYVGQSAASSLALADAREESERAYRQSQIREECLDEFRSLGRIVVPISGGR